MASKKMEQTHARIFLGFVNDGLGFPVHLEEEFFPGPKSKNL
jgi:hypothetical protein